MDNIVQIRLSDELKQRLEVIAHRMEVPISTLIRMVLASFSSQPQSVRLTANGFTFDEENRILRSIDYTENAIKEKRAEKYHSMNTALDALEHEIQK